MISINERAGMQDNNDHCEWVGKKLKDICSKINYGLTASATQENTGYKFLRITDIVPDLINWDSVPYCNINSHEFQKYKLNKGDIVIARTGATTGYAKYIRKEVNAVFASYLVRITIDESNDAEFISKIIESKIYKKFIQSQLTGSAQPQANAQVLTSFEISLPPKQIQSQVASILSAYDDLIEINTNRIKLLEEIAQRLYTEWFVKFRFPGYEKVRMVDSGAECGFIPEGWEIRKIGDIAKQKRNSVNPEKIDQNTPYVGLEHIPRKAMVLSVWGAAEDVKSSKLSFQKGDILFGKIRPYFHKVVVAPLDGVSSTDAIVIIPKEEKLRSLIFLCVFSALFVSYATQTSQGTKMPRAEWSTLEEFPIVVPRDDMLSRFNTIINGLIDEMQIIMQKNRNLIKIRDLLISQLINGKREIKDVSIFKENCV